jgi:DNA-binding LacI/PurR family transcriptional regulator
MPRKPGKLRLSDVALAADVSPATVSRLMRGAAEVNPQTRRRIELAAQKLKFNLHGKQKTRIIAFLLSNRGVLHSFHSAVLMGVESYCAEHDYGLLFLPMTYSLSTQTQDLDIPEILLRTRIVAGVVVAGANSQNILDAFSRRRMPWVVLGNNVVGDWNHDCPQALFFDDIEGAAELTRYLLSLGHKRIGFVGDLKMPWYLRRFQAYKETMESAGLPLYFSDIASRDSEEMGYLATKILLQSNPRITAIFAGDDASAYGVYKAAKDTKLSVPEELSVVGFNDTPEASALDPPLTSVRVFTYELGRQLAQLLINQLSNADSPVTSSSMPARLIRRESCMPPLLG